MNSEPRKRYWLNSRHRILDAVTPRILMMVLLFASAAVFEATHLTSLSSLSNGDVWWHLRTGIWILQNHGVPHSGIFSQSPQSPWTAASWGYEVLVVLAYRMLGLRFMPILLIAFKAALAVATFLLAGGLRGNFWSAALLSAVTQYILGGVQPGPGYCSILMFAVELLLLTGSRSTGNVRPLYGLPLLFLVWANLDIQFIYGLLLLLLYLIASVLQDLGRRLRVPVLQQEAIAIPVARGGMVATFSLFATFVTPYSYHLYGVFWSGLTSAANRYFLDFRAMTFRRPQDYVLLLLVMGAFLALGLRRSRDPFQIALMAGCAMLSFHSQRNAWLAALASVAVIAEVQVGVAGPSAVTPPDDRKVVAAAPWRDFLQRPVYSATWAALALVLVVLAVATQRIPRDHDQLLARVGRGYPVQACNFIREHGLPQPLFNAIEWGGFLIWYLPEDPVAIDGRADLYGEETVSQYFKAMNADIPYTAYPAMGQARMLLLQRKSLMGDALSTLPRFKVAYSDDVAVVL
ncbi:MAG: hypothetical protein ABSD20_13600, partial [Terriglobales bacterium]